MRKIYQTGLGLLLVVSAISATAQQKANPDSDSQSKKSNMEVVLIDRFVIPASAKSEFLERTRFNRDFIKSLPGFVGDSVYEDDEPTESRIVTIAVWASQEAINNARATVTEYYKKEGFDVAAFTKKLNIRMERGIYKKRAE